MVETVSIAGPLRITNDFIFRYVFGREGHEDLLLSLVNAVLARTGVPLAQSIRHVNTVQARDATWARESVLDIRVTDPSGRQFDVEMQVANRLGFAQRSLFYWGQLYSAQLGRGNDFRTLRPVICINILAHEMFEDLPGNHQWFLIRHGKRPYRILTKDFMLHYVELAKPNESMGRRGAGRSATGRLATWIEFFRRECEGADMTEIIKRDPLLSKAHDAFERCTHDEALRAEALSRELWRLDQATREGIAYDKGIDQGIDQGVRKTARAMKELGIETNLIMKATGLGQTEVEEL